MDLSVQCNLITDRILMALVRTRRSVGYILASGSGHRHSQTVLDSKSIHDQYITQSDHNNMKGRQMTFSKLDYLLILS